MVWHIEVLLVLDANLDPAREGDTGSRKPHAQFGEVLELSA